MDCLIKNPLSTKTKSPILHVRNIHKNGYDFAKLKIALPDIKRFIQLAPAKHDIAVRETIDFANPEAVRALNTALLAADYQITGWSIPNGALCPAIPGRADYIHHIADLLCVSLEPNKSQQAVRLLDIGTGANGVYPLLASQIYNWFCVASDISQTSLNNVDKILDVNPNLKQKINLRLQSNPHHFFEGIILADEFFDVTVCNPPFFASQLEAIKANTKKVSNLGRSKQANPSEFSARKSSNFNFGGYENELWCNGGEKLFLKKMIKESKNFAQQCGWFSSLVSKSEHVSPCVKIANKQGAKEVQVIEMGQGNKLSRVLAWRF